MTATTGVPRVQRTSPRRRDGLRSWFDEDHVVSSAILVPLSFAGLLGLLLLGYVLLAFS